MKRHIIGISVITLGLASVLAQGPSNGQKVSGPIPVTADSYPQLAANRTQEPVDLAKRGYVEEEFIVAGLANVYRWEPDGRVTPKTKDAPYATRVLARRPSDARRFSGNVIVELLNEARGYDWSFIWALSYEHFIERGDAFVGVTHVPENVDALKKFNADRYAALSFANPNPAETCGGRGALTAPSEEGLRWDAISQIGALLKNQGPMGLMPGLRVERLYMTSHHGHAVTYAIAMQGGAKLPNGKPIYDGFLIKSSDNPVRLSRCDAAPQSGDPRQAVRNVGVPVIRVVPQGEIPRGNSYSRADSDDPADRFRLYEAPGAPRMDKIYFQQLPAKEDQVKAGQSASDAKWPFTYQCGPDSRSELVDYPAMRFIVDVAFDHLDRWVRTGTPPPRAERIAGGDMFGNAKGGVRNPYIEVPTATYVPIGPGQCSSIMTRTEFDRARFDELYGSSEKYLARFNESVDRLVKEGWITAGDAMRIKAENGSAPRRN